MLTHVQECYIHLLALHHGKLVLLRANSLESGTLSVSVFLAQGKFQIKTSNWGTSIIYNLFWKDSRSFQIGWLLPWYSWHGSLPHTTDIHQIPDIPAIRIAQRHAGWEGPPPEGFENCHLPA